MPVLHQRLALVVFLFLLSVPLLAQGLVCTVCGQQVMQGHRVDGKVYCPEHLDAAFPKCSNCGVPIRGRFYTVSSEKLTICQECHSKFKECYLCLRPVDTNRGGKLLADGRAICAVDVKTGVTNSQSAKRIFYQAQSEVLKTFGPRLRLKKPIESVRLVDAKELNKVKSNRVKGTPSGRQTYGVASMMVVHSGGKRQIESATIYLLNYIPKETMLPVSAHEYAHVWHAENHQNYQDLSPEMHEGFAQWVAYKTTEKYGRTKELESLSNPDGGVYYTGLQKFLQLERRWGVDGVLRYATEATTI